MQPMQLRLRGPYAKSPDYPQLHSSAYAGTDARTNACPYRASNDNNYVCDDCAGDACAYANPGMPAQDLHDSGTASAAVRLSRVWRRRRVRQPALPAPEQFVCHMCKQRVPRTAEPNSVCSVRLRVQ